LIETDEQKDNSNHDEEEPDEIEVVSMFLEGASMVRVEIQKEE